MHAIPCATDLNVGALSQCAMGQTRIPANGHSRCAAGDVLRHQPTRTAIVRPSSRSTDTVSSVTVTLMILGRMSVTTAEGVPFMSQSLQMLTDNALDVTQLSAAIAV